MSIETDFEGLRVIEVTSFVDLAGRYLGLRLKHPEGATLVAIEASALPRLRDMIDRAMGELATRRAGKEKPRAAVPAGHSRPDVH